MASSVKSLNNLRPRERLLRHGAATLSDAELLAIVLRTGSRQGNVLHLAQALLQHFQGLQGLLASSATQLQRVHGIGEAKSCEVLAISEINRRALLEQLQRGPTLNQPQTVKQYCIARIGHQPVEHCLALYLDNQLQLITAEEIAKGTINQASVYPRELVRAALQHHACAIILAHNHPSGVAAPSQADIALTQHLKQALQLVDVQLLDHLIITPGYANSMAENNLL